MTFAVHIFVLFLNVKLAEEVEGDDGVDVTNDCQKTNGEDELFAIVSNGLKDDPESGDANGDVNEVGSEEEVVVVAEDGEDEVPQLVQKRVVCESDPSLPNLDGDNWMLDGHWNIY